MFVVNGFYSAMREQYLAPGTHIQCYVVDFPEESLPWEQFRNQVRRRRRHSRGPFVVVLVPIASASVSATMNAIMP